MSHTVAIKTSFKKVMLLKEAFKQLGWSTTKNTVRRTYNYDPKRNQSYDIVAVNPVEHGYDIGIVKNGKNIDLDLDYYGGSIDASLSETNRNTGETMHLSKLKKKYIQLGIEEEFEAMGYNVNVVELPNGAQEVQVLS